MLESIETTYNQLDKMISLLSKHLEKENTLWRQLAFEDLKIALKEKGQYVRNYLHLLDHLREQFTSDKIKKSFPKHLKTKMETLDTLIEANKNIASGAGKIQEMIEGLIKKSVADTNKKINAYTPYGTLSQEGPAKKKRLTFNMDFCL